MAATAARADRVRGWLFWSIVAAGLFFVPWPARLVDEFYSHGFYPWLQRWLTAASNRVPMAVFDLLVSAAGVAVVFRLLRLLVLASRRGLLSAAWDAVRRTLRAVSIVVLAFMCAWGCNYRRLPLEASLGRGSDQPKDSAALHLAIADANALAARIRGSAKPDITLDYAVLADGLRTPMNAALGQLQLAPLSRPGRPKVSVLLTPFFTWAGVDGMIDPFALESIVHPELLPFERGYVLAHEWAHLAGEADEAEASAVGWFACMQAPPVFAYSASLYLILEAASALPPGDRRQAYSTLNPEVRADLEAIGRRLQRRQPQVQRAASKVYDSYLKANRVADGTASYSRALRLILAEPLRRALTTYAPPKLSGSRDSR